MKKNPQKDIYKYEICQILNFINKITNIKLYQSFIFCFNYVYY